MSSWRWLLILEGLPAVICGVLAYLLLPNRPAEAKFLTESEKDWIITQLKDEEDNKRGTHQLSAVGALGHKRVWHLAGTVVLHGAVAYTLFFWMPQVVKTLSQGYSNARRHCVVRIATLVLLLPKRARVQSG